MIALQKVVDNQGRENIGNSKSLPRAVPLQVGNSEIQSSDEQMVMKKTIFKIYFMIIARLDSKYKL